MYTIKLSYIDDFGYVQIEYKQAKYENIHSVIETFAHGHEFVEVKEITKNGRSGT